MGTYSHQPHTYGGRTKPRNVRKAGKTSPYDPVADLASMQTRLDGLYEMLGGYLAEDNKDGVTYCETQTGFVREAMDRAVERTEVTL